jgi:hypothetical protein
MLYNQKNDKDLPVNSLQEPEADYGKEEMDRLKDALRRSYTERFLMATRLYKVQQTMQRAKITYKPYTLDK